MSTALVLELELELELVQSADAAAVEQHNQPKQLQLRFPPVVAVAVAVEQQRVTFSPAQVEPHDISQQKQGVKQLQPLFHPSSLKISVGKVQSRMQVASLSLDEVRVAREVLKAAADRVEGRRLDDEPIAAVADDGVAVRSKLRDYQHTDGPVPLSAHETEQHADGDTSAHFQHRLLVRA